MWAEMKAPTFNPNIQEAERQVGVETSLVYIARPFLKTKQTKPYTFKAGLCW